MTNLTYRQRVAEHEAAHAVVAGRLGVNVYSLSLHGTSVFDLGGTTRRGLTTPDNAAIIAAAGYTWERYYMPRDKAFSTLSYLNGLADRWGTWRLMLFHGASLRKCRRSARRILGQDQARVIRLGTRLNRQGSLQFR